MENKNSTMRFGAMWARSSLPIFTPKPGKTPMTIVGASPVDAPEPVLTGMWAEEAPLVTPMQVVARAAVPAPAETPMPRGRHLPLKKSLKRARSFTANSLAPNQEVGTAPLVHPEKEDKVSQTLSCSLREEDNGDILSNSLDAIMLRHRLERERRLRPEQEIPQSWGSWSPPSALGVPGENAAPACECSRRCS